ncbi:MAG: tetratricopeptide repeat protein, partial [Spirochaetales bacterium]|nr:tetratricopeptide repeat protein [Spirochaetales bacterium]
MFRFLRTLFTKPAPPPAPGSSPEHRYCPDFSSLEASGFEAVDESRYHTRVEDGAFVLELKKPSLFAWADDGTFRYADVSIEAEIDFSDDDQEQASPQQASPLRASPLRAAGLLLRKAAESSFVYALISSEADVRLDMVFNGEPRTLIPWTACPWARGASRFVLSVVARGSHFVVMVNGRFALEAEDDSLASGGIAFAAQSYSEPAVFRLVSYRVESRPVEVEADYLRYARIIEADADQRRRLAEGLFSLGYFVAALVQLQKIADRGAETANDAFLKAECLLRLDMPGEAAQAIEECLALDPTKEEAIEERYNVMYLCGEYSRLKEALESDAARVAGSPRLANLLGHAYYNGGSWAKAASSYGVAARGEPTMPIYSRNYARALEKAGQPSDASAAWLAAARGFYEQGAWDDALECSARLRELGYDKVTLDSLEAMIDYGGGEPAKAEPVLARLFRKGLADAPASYVYGLILARRGKRTEAIKAFRQAASLEPERPLYRYRLAESLFMAGEPYQAELDAAIEAAPDDGWTLNLAGQAAMRRG